MLNVKRDQVFSKQPVVTFSNVSMFMFFVLIYLKDNLKLNVNAKMMTNLVYSFFLLVYKYNYKMRLIFNVYACLGSSLG